MPDFDPKLGKQLPPPPALGSEQEVGPGQGTTLAKEAATAAAHQPEAPQSPEMAPSILRELFLLFRDMLRNGKGWPMLRLGAAILVILVGNMFGQVRLNQWNGAFFDAVERRDSSTFFDQLLVFLVIVAVLLALVVAQTWLQERLKIRLRQRLTQVLLDIWLKPNRAYQMGFMGENSAQPDQRMQEDCRLFSELSTELGVGMVQAFLLLVSFIGVLWALSSPVSFTLGGHEITIPGYMVWVAVGYAGIGSGLTWLVGRPMIRLNTLRYAREAELRFALVRVNESAESVALYNGEPDERRNLDEFVEAVLKASRRLSGGLARLTWITSGYGWLAIVVPILAAAPDYFAGRLSFGEMMMVVGAFNQVQAALRYFVDNFPKIADWRSAVLRVATFRQAAIDLDEVTAESRKIEVGPHPKGWLSFEGVSIALNDGSILIEDATAEIQPGDAVPGHFRPLALGIGQDPHPQARGDDVPAAASLSPLGNVAGRHQLPGLARDLRRRPGAGSARALRPGRVRRDARQARALGPEPVAGPTAAGGLRPRAAAPAQMGVHGRGDFGPRRGEPGLHAGAVRKRADGGERPVDRAPARPRGVPHPHPSHPQDQGRGHSPGPAPVADERSLAIEARAEMDRALPPEPEAGAGPGMRREPIRNVPAFQAGRSEQLWVGGEGPVVNYRR